MAEAVVEAFAADDLEFGEGGEAVLVEGKGGGRKVRTCPLLFEEMQEAGVAEVLLEVDIVGEVLGIDFRDREAQAVEVAAEGHKGFIFAGIGVVHADGGGARTAKTEVLAV